MLIIIICHTNHLIMLIIHVVIFVALYNTVHARYSIYHSDIRQNSYLSFDCLYAHSIEGRRNDYRPYINDEYLIPYCRRLDNDEKQEEIFDTADENIANKINFNELKKQGVTSEQLLNWLAPIDVAERYEMNNENSEIFYNCSSPWFGSKCQYRFVYNISLSFNEIVEAFEENRMETRDNVSISTCYRFLADCDRGLWSLCLDWRQICDGKVDCTNGKDEQWCGILEMTKCADDEYRCHYGGQCIPQIFVRDAGLTRDCLDGSEEQELQRYSSALVYGCGSKQTMFSCEELINRYPYSFSCGDGTFLTSSCFPVDTPHCINKRDKEVTVAMLTSFDYIEDVNCRQAFRCSLLSNRSYGYATITGTFNRHEYFEGTWDKDCELLSNYCLNEWLIFPEHPIMYGFFQFVYLTNRSISEFKNNVAPDFVCFDVLKCPILLSKIVPIEIMDELTCFDIFHLTMGYEIKHFHTITMIFSTIYDQCLKTGNESSCVNSSYFHCNQSLKCISYYRVGDGFSDCYYNEDESFSACHLNDSNRVACKSIQTEPDICLTPVTIGNGRRDCLQGEDETDEYIYGALQQILFPSICNSNEQEHWSLNITGNETDETNCDWWPCHNPYTHCDTFWDCLNGIDELNCPNTNCSSNEFQCKNEHLNMTYCLPLMHMYHKRIDNCNRYEFILELYFDNSTNDISNDYNSFNKSKCTSEDNICNQLSKTVNLQEEVCLKNQILDISISPTSYIYKLDNDSIYLCTIDQKVGEYYENYKQYWSALRIGYFPARKFNISLQNVSQTNQHRECIPQMNSALMWHCHYGILIISGSNNQTKRCLCPPNYFGSQCQWQSQRISLTIQIEMQTIISSTVIFQLIIMLMDEQGIIASNHEQIIYIPVQKCNTKFHIYLLYPNRPKNLSANYSIRIDLFNKSTLDYWNSWYLPIPFQFLPVNRIAVQLIVPKVRTSEECSLECGKHGRCTRYTNMNNSLFCRCDQGYSGSFCNIMHQCQCSNDSLCLAPSICVCPLNKFGSHCYLKRSICQSTNNPCQHNGLCIGTDDRINLHGFICFCKEDYYGEQCQYKSNQIDIHLDDRLILINSSLFIHYIAGFKRASKHERTTILKKIPFGQNTITIHVSQTFNILFVEISDNDYYLIILREKFIQSEYIYVQVQPQQRCFPIHNLLNDTFRQYQYLRRIKYYPLLCRENPQLMCFYDETNMCICDLDRFSNCFQFNRTIKHDCGGKNLCDGNARCFTNNETCPTTFICVCDDCRYGNQCQFSTEGYIFSLDAILGYHIKPNITLSRQPFIVKFSIAINIIMLISGLILGSFSLITFRLKESREVGCGYYLLATSIVSICMVIVLTIKFWQLILSQQSLITNQSMLYVNCVSIEIVLKVCLTSIEWFNACVAIERMFSVIKGVFFNRKKSRTIAKQVIFIIIISMIATHIHDPIYRQLVYDSDGGQQRIWCTTQYSSSLTTYNTFITLFHILTPFLINFISTILLIVLAAYKRFQVESKYTLKQHFRLQFQQHKHILIAPGLLILLNLPRLIISFTTGCMRSPRESWLYLIGYFLSFIPAICTFFVFVLPLTTYKNAFDKTIKKWISRFRSRF